MNCPRCSATVAFNKNQCDNCGQDLRVYRRTVSLSNYHYNNALEQAKTRDLTGAINSLKLSLQFNKLNISARNLLGLIYYETGEVVYALGEWVISRHYREKGNDANEYITKVQSNPGKLDQYNQAIKKYNIALSAVRQGDEDMAVIQLKKVISLNPKFIRAHHLLALLYMKSEKKENRLKAFKLLMHIKDVDITNSTTLRYLDELKDLNTKANRVAANAEKNKPPRQEVLSRAEPDPYRVITPYKEEKPSVMPFIYIIIGVITGLALMFFLVLPQIKSNINQKANNKFKKYSEKLAAADSEISTLQNEKDNLTNQVNDLTGQLATLQGTDAGQVSSVQQIYENIFTAYDLFQQGQKLEAAKILIKVSAESLNTEIEKKYYNQVKDGTFAEASDYYFEKGKNRYNGEGEYEGKKDIDKAIKQLEKALKYNPDNTDALYYLGRCHQSKSDSENAKVYYKKIVDEHPDADIVSDARSRLRELGE